MNHTYDGKYNRNGSIFTKNSNPFEEFETTLYGHNMRNNIMFSEIEKYMKEDFFYAHPTFTIYTKNTTYQAKVFSIYSIGVDEENKNIKTLDNDAKIQYYKNQSKYKVEVEEEQKNILKLSTCSYVNSKTTPTDQRYFLVSYLNKIE